MIKNCEDCGHQMNAHRKIQRFCPACVYERKKARQRKYDARMPYVYAKQTETSQRKPEPQRTVFRAASLAETPEIPASLTDRDDMLTGAAAAAVFLSAGRLVGAGG